jgi:hypothetical protein
VELQEIEVVIDPDGTTRIEVRGVAGPSCLSVTESLESVLGGEVVSREMTAEAQAAVGNQVDDHLRRRG